MKTHDLNVENLKKRIRELESDAREYQRMEDELRTSQERFRILIETLPYGVVEVSLDGVITLTNRAMHVLCDAADDGEGLVGRHIGDLIADPDENAAMPALMQAAAESLRPAEPYVTRIRTRRNRRIDVQVAWDYKRGEGGSVFGFIAVVTDITERLKADRALKESEQRYRSLFEKAGDAIFLIQGQGPDAGKILDANQAAADMHGYTLEELKSMSIQQIDGPEDADKVADRLRRILGGEWIHAQITHYRKDGSAFPVSLSAGLVSMGDKKGRPGHRQGHHRTGRNQGGAPGAGGFSADPDRHDSESHLLQRHPWPLPGAATKPSRHLWDMSRRDIVGRTIREIDNILQADEIEAVDRVLFASREPQILRGNRPAGQRDAPGRSFSTKRFFIRKMERSGGLVGSLIDIKDPPGRWKRKRPCWPPPSSNRRKSSSSPTRTAASIMSTRRSSASPAMGATRAAGRTPSLLKSGKHDDAFFREMWQTLTAGNSWKGRITNRPAGTDRFSMSRPPSFPVQRTDGQITDYLAVRNATSPGRYSAKSSCARPRRWRPSARWQGASPMIFNNILSAIIGFYRDRPCTTCRPTPPTRTFLSRVLTAGDRARALVNQILAFSRASEQAVAARRYRPHHQRGPQSCSKPPCPAPSPSIPASRRRQRSWPIPPRSTRW